MDRKRAREKVCAGSWYRLFKLEANMTSLSMNFVQIFKTLLFSCAFTKCLTKQSVCSKGSTEI